MKRFALLMMLFVWVMGATFAQDDAEKTPLFIPVGGGYTDTYPGFVEAVMTNMDADDDFLYIVVMPLAYSYDAAFLSADDLILNSRDSERRRRQLEEACAEVAGEAIECRVVVAPIYTTEAANSEYVLDYFDEDLDGIYFLGGDQTTAMQVAANTALEQALADAYAAGVVMGGNSAGLAIQAKTMIAGYTGDLDENSGFAQGAVDLWNTDEQRGLSFGVENVLLEQHFFEFVRLPRLVNAVVQADVPHVAVGVDGYTGAYLQNGVVDRLFGLYTAIVLDAQTLGAVDSANYENGTLSVRNMLVHMLAPGAFSYDTNTFQHSLAPTLTAAERNIDFAYSAAGTLILAGNAPLMMAAEGLTVQGDAVVLAVNYPDAETAQAAADEIASQVIGEATVEIVNDAISTDLSAAELIIVRGYDLSTFDPSVLAPVVEALNNGAMVIADNAAAAVFGTTYSAHGPTREATDDNPYAEEEDVQGALIKGNTVFGEGLGVVNAMIEPRVITDARFGRMFALAYNAPSVLAIGLADESGLAFSAEGVTVLGTNSVLTLDLSAATLAEGENGGFVWANGLLDTFAQGESLSFTADE